MSSSLLLPHHLPSFRPAPFPQVPNHTTNCTTIYVLYPLQILTAIILAIARGGGGGGGKANTTQGREREEAYLRQNHTYWKPKHGERANAEKLDGKRGCGVAETPPPLSLVPLSSSSLLPNSKLESTSRGKERDASATSSVKLPSHVRANSSRRK